MSIVPLHVGDDLWLEPLGWLSTVRTVEQVGDEIRITVSLPAPDEDGEEADSSIDDCTACDAPLSTCSRADACCGDCTHSSNFAPESNGSGS